MNSTETKQETLAYFNQQQEKKWIGYLFRIGSATSFAFVTIIGKYFLENIPTLQMISMSALLSGMGIALPIILFYFAYNFFFSQKTITNTFQTKIKPNLSSTFYLIIFLDFLFQVLYFFSSDYIPASHTALYLTLAPLVGLFISVIFLGEESGIFKKRFLALSLFSMASLGSIFIFVSKENFAFARHDILGEFYATLLVFLDVWFTIALMKYYKLKNTFSPFLFTAFFMFIMGLAVSPIYIPFLFSHFSDISTHDWTFLFLLGTSLFTLKYCTMESYNRCNGLINYLLMNLFPIGVVVLEYYYFNLSISYIFIIGLVLILGSSFIIEYINTKEERKDILCK